MKPESDKNDTSSPQTSGSETLQQDLMELARLIGRLIAEKLCREAEQRNAGRSKGGKE